MMLRVRPAQLITIGVVVVGHEAREPVGELAVRAAHRRRGCSSSGIRTPAAVEHDDRSSPRDHRARAVGADDAGRVVGCSASSPKVFEGTLTPANSAIAGRGPGRACRRRARARWRSPSAQRAAARPATATLRRRRTTTMRTSRRGTRRPHVEFEAAVRQRHGEEQMRFAVLAVLAHVEDGDLLAVVQGGVEGGRGDVAAARGHPDRRDQRRVCTPMPIAWHGPFSRSYACARQRLERAAVHVQVADDLWPWISTEWMSSGISAMPWPGFHRERSRSAQRADAGLRAVSRRRRRVCSRPSTAAMQAQVVWLCGRCACRAHHVQVERVALVGVFGDQVAGLGLARLGRREVGRRPERAPRGQALQGFQDGCQGCRAWVRPRRGLPSSGRWPR